MDIAMLSREGDLLRSRITMQFTQVEMPDGTGYKAFNPEARELANFASNGLSDTISQKQFEMAGRWFDVETVRG
jgi:hypothetical protein